jgi:hypothetical protein
MNIAAVMAALDRDDLDRTAKQVVVVLACRADLDGCAQVSIARVARDCGVNYGTAWRAMNRCVKAGVVTVDKLPSSGRVWKLAVRAHARARSRDDDQIGRAMTTKSVARGREQKDLKTRIKNKERNAASLAQSASGAAPVQNGHAAPTRHTDTCLCGGSGWVAGDDATVTRCPYRPEVVR